MLENHDFNNSGLIAIEEPESHLHSGAIHMVNRILREASKRNQVIITTHNSCFVDRINIDSNIIVSNGTCKPAEDLSLIREELGINFSENLINSDYIIIVEGVSDVKIFKKLLSEANDNMRTLINNNTISIISAKGAGKISYTMNIVEMMGMKCYAILDNDDAGRDEEESLNKQGYQNVTKIISHGKKNTEIEDLLPLEFINQSLKNFCMILDNKYKPELFSSRIKLLCNDIGKKYSDDMLNYIKTEISTNVEKSTTIFCELSIDVVDYFKKTAEIILNYFNLN